LTGGKVVALALCCSLVGGAVGAGGVAFGSGLLRNGSSVSGTSNILEGDRTVSVLNVSHVDTNQEMTAAEVYAANVNSTVGITTSIVTTNWWGIPTTAAAAGSGFILSDDGYILTNYHVVEGASSVTVTMYDDTTYDASLVGYDESNDIAVLKVDATGLTPVILGDSDAMNVGDEVVAIGNPLGELTFSLTKGSVSALDRQITLSTSSSSSSSSSSITMNLIQTDCAINSGNSGGPLFNLYGEVIGITNAKYSSSSSSSSASIDNIGFAIPINHVKSIVESIIEKGYIAKPYIGVSVDSVSSSEQTKYGVPAGAVIMSVTEDSPAEKAGLQTGDIVTKLNDTEITDSDDLVTAVGECSPNDVVTLSVYRSGETIEVSITIGEQQQSAMGETSSTDEDDTQSQQYQNQQGSQYYPWGYSFGGN
jgi:serine protease Do